MIRNDSVASRLAELQPLIEARLKGAEKIAQVVEDAGRQSSRITAEKGWKSAGCSMRQQLGHGNPQPFRIHKTD